MTLAIATTKIAVKRPSSGTDIDPYVVSDNGTDVTVSTGIPAHISSPSGRERVAGGSQEVVENILLCDSTDLDRTDRVVDETTGLTYEVTWVDKRIGLGLDHIVCGLVKVEGQA